MYRYRELRPTRGVEAMGTCLGLVIAFIHRSANPHPTSGPLGPDNSLIHELRFPLPTTPVFLPIPEVNKTPRDFDTVIDPSQHAFSKSKSPKATTVNPTRYHT